MSGIKDQDQNGVQNTNLWGKLTSFNINYDNVTLTKDSYTVGRNSSCDIQISDIKLSGTHCRIYKDEEGNYWVEDLSSNGTFIDNKVIGKGNKQKITSGEKIYLLHSSKVKQNEVIGFVFSAFQEESKVSKRQREDNQKALAEEQKQNEKSRKFQEELGEEMRCCICIDYIYQCVTLIPCLHNFCAACFSDWMEKSHECPQCREKGTELKKNHVVNNIIEKFLASNPDKKRPQEEYEGMNKKNKIKEDRFILPKDDTIIPSRTNLTPINLPPINAAPLTLQNPINNNNLFNNPIQTQYRGGMNQPNYDPLLQAFRNQNQNQFNYGFNQAQNTLLNTALNDPFNLNALLNPNLNLNPNPYTYPNLNFNLNSNYNLNRNNLNANNANNQNQQYWRGGYGGARYYNHDGTL